ncbi:hypothetical protein Lfu02_05100 [Longispora fulva]|uniref:DUF3592 domain-containing protein n=1 Tax=Longispora fulva TaxID=619741 RepID=A0A8J7GGH3_9ACTN|nr:hypothetical protein [Longispora fulva]MBG6135623.1 hypothetical protein [Longispora fulva]GIG56138.1 hypothetical protein Lfu02_05100 [Longispora fulva]
MWLLARLSVLSGALAFAAFEAGLFLYVSKILGIVVGIGGFVFLGKTFGAMIPGTGRMVATGLLLVPTFLLAPPALHDEVLREAGIRTEGTVVDDWYLNHGAGDESTGPRTIRVRQCVVRLADGRTVPQRIDGCDTPVGERITLTVDPGLRLTPSRWPPEELNRAPIGWLAATGLFVVVYLLGELGALVGDSRRRRRESGPEYLGG